MAEKKNGAPGLRYQKVADSLRQDILRGRYRVGERLPRQHDLAASFQVSFNTLKQGLDVLEREGYLIRKVGQGTYAALPQEDRPLALVVDDESSFRLLLTRMLSRKGWDAESVATGLEAFEKIQDKDFDLIFIDLVMPGMSGVEVLRRLREQQVGAGMVLVTAYPDSAMLAQALKCGPFTVLRKPLELEDVDMVLSAARVSSGTISSGVG